METFLVYRRKGIYLKQGCLLYENTIMKPIEEQGCLNFPKTNK